MELSSFIKLPLGFDDVRFQYWSRYKSGFSIIPLCRCFLYAMSSHMHKAFQYRLKPTAKQATTLAAHLEECRMLYNHFVVDRIQACKDRGKSLGRYDQINQLPFLKTDRSTLAQVHSQVLQNVAVRVDLAFQPFYRRCKDGGEKPGFPRFKGIGRYDSLTYPQATAFRLDDKGLRLSKIGCQGNRILTPCFLYVWLADVSSTALLSPLGRASENA